MKRLLILLSLAALSVAVISCKDYGTKKIQSISESFKHENEFMKDAVRHRSPDVQKVEIIGNSVVYTHIFDGIIDMKTYFYDGDICVESERVFTYPSQMSALRHYRRAVEEVELYDDIKLVENEVRYDLKEAQHKIETAGLTKEQLKEKFEKQIAAAKADIRKVENCAK